MMAVRRILIALTIVLLATQGGCKVVCPTTGCCQSQCLAPGIYRGGPIPPAEPCRDCNPVRPRCCHCDGRYQLRRAMSNLVDSVYALGCECPGVGEVDPCCYPVPACP